jgi:hypothetical protein
MASALSKLPHNAFSASTQRAAPSLLSNRNAIALSTQRAALSLLSNRNAIALST